MFVQHYRHCSSCGCDSSPVGLHLWYDASRLPHVAAFSVDFSLLGVGFDVVVMGGEEEVAVAAEVGEVWCGVYHTRGARYLPTYSPLKY